MPNKIVRCVVCLSEYDEQSVADEPACPTCKSVLGHEYVHLDLTVKTNWDDLRLLCNWALNWAEAELDEDDSGHLELELILQKLRQFRPADSEPLTLDDALAELSKIGIDLKDPEEKPQLPRKVVVNSKPPKLLN